jgi:AmiR/NasT family two-component response regulator
MHSDAAVEFLLSKVLVTRELIARAKTWLAANRSGHTEELAQTWLREQNLADRREIDGTSPGIEDELTDLAKCYAARLVVRQS